MTLPVSKYEELLETVRNLKQQTIRVRELASPLLDTIISANIITGETSSNSFHFYSDFVQDEKKNASLLKYSSSVYENRNYYCCHTRSVSAMESLLVERQYDVDVDVDDEVAVSSSSEKFTTHRDSLNRNRNESHDSVSPTDIDITSVMSFASSSGAAVPFGMCNSNSEVTAASSEGEEARQRQQQLDVKVEMVYSLLAVLGTSECPDMGETLLALSSSPDSSRAMRQAGCLSILVQLVHAKDDKAAQALRNLVQGQTDDKQKRRELKILRLLEDIRAHCNETKDEDEEWCHPTQATENIIKLSFDEGYRHTICELGGIFTLARLIEVEHSRHGALPTSDKCVTLRRYAGMALTNLTFGHGRNKSLLCSFGVFMRCLVAQLGSPADELRQVTASVLRNLSWRADGASRAALRDAGAVPALMHAAMRSRREATLKSVLSALWNLSAHCSTNKADICAVPGALAFLVDMLGYRPPSTTLTITENAGGILRNVSSHIAVRDDYRAVLRDKGCLPLLLQQLKSPSLTVVSNACGTLWNLSAKCEQDQRALWDMGAAPMLRSLNHSKHAMIATGSRAALKNLLSSRPTHNLFNHVDATAREMGLPTLPTLGARKQRALAKDLDQNLSETCDNIEPTSPVAINTVVTQQLVESFASLNLLTDYTFEQDTPEEVIEEPIDYSQKYVENNNVNDNKKKTDYSDYAETDLDQPTNYSLRYAENDSDSDIIQDEGQFDTVKTYCTEGTPLNFSTATSMSDLRQIDSTCPDDKEKKKKTKNKKEEATVPKYRKEGVMNKVNEYCEEGTPRSFSRHSSFSSLNIDDTQNNSKQEEKVATRPDGRVKFENITSAISGSGSATVGGSNAAANGIGAEETPLMFSRCSSLCSVSSAEQHSIHDDRSSIISDFSRLTSGIVSPSELPDSPTQTVPPSPRQRKQQLNQQTKSVFEDNVIKFKQANTPIEFSANTSLSSLTIDDELPANINFNLLAGVVLGAGTMDITNKIQDKMKPESTTLPLPLPQPQPQPQPLETTTNNVEINNEQEEDDMLAACINIGIQNNRHREKKQLKQPSTKLGRTGIPRKAPPLPEVDTTRVYCTEDTPAMLSHAGSQSDLSLLSVESPANRKCPEDKHNVNALNSSDDSSNLSGDNESNILAECIQSGMPKAKGVGMAQTRTQTRTRLASITNDEIATYAVEDSPCQFSLRSSLSDLTIDGVPAQKKKKLPPASAVLSHADSLSSLSSTENAEQVLLEQCISSGMPAKNNKASTSSKNVPAPSVALDWTNSRATGDENETETETETEIKTKLIKHFNSWQQSSENDKHIILNTKMIIKNNHDNIDKCSDLLDGSIEDNCYENNCTSVHHTVDNRMLDPDAMIESLDRFTAELVSQSSHLQQSYGNGSGHGNGNDTWNEDTSPNDVSFPSISISAPLPLVASFNNSEDVTDAEDNKQIQPESLDTTTSTMTDSTLIAIEAANIVNSAKIEFEMQESITSLDLEHMKPPSVMDSLVSLTSSVSDAPVPRVHSPLLAARKRSLPIGNLMMRRALTHTNMQDGPASISSCSNLDYVKPPSVMGDFLDLVDMENSMISVASITSETTDDDKQYFMSAVDDLDPDLNDSTADLITENVFQDCFTHPVDDVTLTEYSDATSVTPVQSDFASSSAETTPKKERSICMRMTPKQRRQYAKDRYKTYTVAAEMVIRQVTDTSAKKLTPKERRQLDRERFQTRVLDVNLIQQQLENSSSPPPVTNDIRAVTIKQRRLENKERFRTQTLSSNDSEQDDLHLVLAQQANIVLDTLHADELLDCETLSLVSNDDESELNSVSSINYRTYHKSWGFNKNLPVVQSTTNTKQLQQQSEEEIDATEAEEKQTVDNRIAKIPKIIKPNEIPIKDEEDVAVKAVRGRRKPLYSSPYSAAAVRSHKKPTSSAASLNTNTTTPMKSIKQPFRTMTSNLVKNVTTTIKTTTRNKSTTIANKPPLAANKLNVVRSNTTPFKSHSNIVKNAIPQAAAAAAHKDRVAAVNKHELLKNRSSSNGSIPLNSKPLERQGTFTKDKDKDNNKKASKIPESKIPMNKFRSSIQSRTISSTTGPGAGSRMNNRSPSTDRSGDFGFRARRSPNTQIHQSNSTQSLQGTDIQHFTIKRSSNPDICTNTNTSENVTTPKRKPVTSRIASLWKKSHSDVGVNDKKSTSVAAATTATTTVKMRKKNNTLPDETKRLSRLGSFIKVDEIPVT